jgi:hypothetical protein
MRAYVSERRIRCWRRCSRNLATCCASTRSPGAARSLRGGRSDHRPDKETEANQTYGIQPTPFQVAGRYEASVINAYFDILVRYGDQNDVLNFRDLIEVERSVTARIDVHCATWNMT